MKCLPVQVILWLAVFGLAACNHASNRSSYTAPRAITYALAVSVRGGLQPTPAQWASLQAKFAKDLAAVGAVLVTDISLADRIIRVEFVPDETDPEGAGRALVLSVRTNPLRSSASASSLAT
ncbi:MAG: hypothetical protein ABIQ12_09375, partial [Opitutaceae bacterium]